MSCEVCMKGYRISLIRHGLTEANEKGIYIGRTDLPLSAKGESELCSKMEEFEYPHVHRVYSSPLRRCTETADILFPSAELCVVEDLIELNFGEFEGKSVDELINRQDYKEWLKGGMDKRAPSGESMEELCVRTYKALHEINPRTSQTYITPYIYNVSAAHLSLQELSDYEHETRNIRNSCHGVKKGNKKSQKSLEMALNRRADILKKAEDKFDVLRDILKDLIKKGPEYYTHLLIFY